MGLEGGKEKGWGWWMREMIEKCGGNAIIDGGFATELERDGADLKDPLWSAKCLITSPHLVRRAYAEVLEEEGIEIPAWFSFSCKDESNVVSGDSIIDCASIADSSTQVVAVGVNCTAPRFIHGLISSIKKVTSKPVVVYPNSGETYIAESSRWVKSSGVDEEDFVSHIGKWRDAGASIFGGCCRTTPNTIRAITQAICQKPL